MDVTSDEDRSVMLVLVRQGMPLRKTVLGVSHDDDLDTPYVIGAPLGAQLPAPATAAD